MTKHRSAKEVRPAERNEPGGKLGQRVATGYRVPGLVERRRSLRSEPAAYATARRGRASGHPAGV